jgi:hypothetical protein
MWGCGEEGSVFCDVWMENGAWRKGGKRRWWWWWCYGVPWKSWQMKEEEKETDENDDEAPCLSARSRHSTQFTLRSRRRAALIIIMVVEEEEEKDERTTYGQRKGVCLCV